MAAWVQADLESGVGEQRLHLLLVERCLLRQCLVEPISIDRSQSIVSESMETLRDSQWHPSEFTVKGVRYDIRFCKISTIYNHYAPPCSEIVNNKGGHSH